MKKAITLVTACVLLGGIAAVSTVKLNANQKSMKDILPLPPALQDITTGQNVPTEALRGKIVALYFSANWCVPCKTFTPKLIKFHEANKGNDFEVVFMSLDNSAAQKASYMKKAGMKWLTAPGQGSENIRNVMNFYKLEGVPSVIVFGPNGEVITTEARWDVTDDPANALSKWKSSLNPKS